MKAKFDNINIVLVEPKSDGNIGSVSRALKTMHFKNLHLISPVEYHTDQAYGMSLFASDVLENAKVFNNLKEAIADVSLVIGMTRRAGRQRNVQYYLPEIVDKIISTSQNNQVSIVFGTEDSGLSLEDTDLCHVLAQIHSDEKYGSLNLSQAVMVTCHEIYKTDKADEPMFNAITTTQLNELLDVIHNSLKNIGYFKQDEPERTLAFLKSLFSRSGIDQKEFYLIKKMFYRIQGTFEKGFMFTRLKEEPEILESRFKAVLKLMDLVNPLEKQAIQIEQNLKHVIEPSQLIELLLNCFLGNNDNDVHRAFWVLLFLTEYPVEENVIDKLKDVTQIIEKDKLQMLLFVMNPYKYPILAIDNYFLKSLPNEEEITRLRPNEVIQFIKDWSVLEKMVFAQYAIINKNIAFTQILNTISSEENFRVRYEIGKRLLEEPYEPYLSALLVLKRDKHLRIRKAAKDTLDRWYELDIIDENYVKPQKTWEEPPRYCFISKEGFDEKYRYLLFLTELKYRVYGYAFVVINLESNSIEKVDGIRRIKEFLSIQEKSDKLCKEYNLVEDTVTEGVKIIKNTLIEMHQNKIPLPSNWKQWKSFIINFDQKSFTEEW